jgi:photosystem II stability/assembly factor-like uncharacterized protein
LKGVSGTAAADASTIAIAGSSTIAATSDGGKTWRTAFQSTPGCTFADLGFTTSTQGVAIVANQGGGGAILVMTRDGGASWQWVTF